VENLKPALPCWGLKIEPFVLGFRGFIAADLPILMLLSVAPCNLVGGY
jgi:hypothetical protein